MSMMRSKGGKRLVADINVTPLVDVMLVLLIIFMVTAPMMTQGIDLDLHETTDAPRPQEQKDQPIIISVGQDGKLVLKESEMSREQLMRELTGMSKEDKKHKMLIIRADRNAPYGLVATLFADARGAGFLNLTPAIR
ncbi:MAG: ExbD/TolR family protein [Desulfobulbaceae bacterium]|jgi:biopolymer transport protein TolR|nr:ExbD/TolR family protein [Desulfobulbaceae bacterium]